MSVTNVVEIPLTGVKRWRYRCPAGHQNWDHTNNHGWCPTCARAAEQGADLEPEFWELHDQKTGETVPWERIEWVE